MDIMDHFYALGIICIQYIQEWFTDSKDYFEWVNEISNPKYTLEYIFPFVSMFDSVFAAQYVLCMGFGQWLNTILKWLFQEDRPYWWVSETTFYTDDERPILRQSYQTCETGPGSPSGHTAMVVKQLILFIMWISHIMNDRKCYVWWWKYIIYPLFTMILGSVILARLFVAAHFPHQCLLAIVIGLPVAPIVCLYVTDPFIWRLQQSPPWVPGVPGLSRGRMCHAVTAVLVAACSVAVYWSLKLFGIDPQWTINAAFRWCENPSWIHLSTTPVYTLVVATATMLGWAVCVTPEIAKYRHYTKNRYILISMVMTVLFYLITKELQSMIDRKSTLYFYACQFLVHFVRPILFLRVVPWFAMWPCVEVEKKRKMI